MIKDDITLNTVVDTIGADILKEKVEDNARTIIEEAKNIPDDLYHEVRSNLNVEGIGTTFVRNPNVSTFDYFNNYYSSYNKRYLPTPNLLQ